MHENLRHYGETAVRNLDAVLAKAPNAPHREVAEAIACIAAFRNQAIAGARDGEVGWECVEKANSLLSLAYGTGFPLIGFHKHRLEQTREEMQRLLDRY